MYIFQATRLYNELMVKDKSIKNLENLKQFKVRIRNIKYLVCYISANCL